MFEGFADGLAVLRIRDYRNFLFARFLSTLSTQMQALIVSWQVYQLTKDPLALGLVGGVEAIVFISFVTWAGHVADKSEKRRIILITQGLLLFCTLALGLLAHRPGETVYWIYALIGLTGLGRSFMWPAAFAYSELTVPREIYARAATWNSTAWEIGSIVGPAIGGFLYAWKGPAFAYAVVAALMTAAIFFSARISPRPPIATPPKDPTSGFWTGMRFVFSNQILLGAMTLDMFAVLFGGAYAVLPIFADRMGVGAQGLGWLRAAPSFGAIVMALIIASRPPFQRAGRALMLSVAFFGLFTLAFALAGQYRLYGWALAALALTGMADNISVVIRASAVQAHTPNHLRGRVSSVNGIFIGSSNELGAFESGLAAKFMGLVPSVVFGGCLTLLTVALVAWKAPKLRKLGVIHKS
jgi:MFS family permease